MARFFVKEQVSATIEVEAETAQDALDAWLNQGKPAAVDGVIDEQVDERWVEDSKGNVCDTEDE